MKLQLLYNQLRPIVSFLRFVLLFVFCSWKPRWWRLHGRVAVSPQTSSTTTRSSTTWSQQPAGVCACSSHTHYICSLWCFGLLSTDVNILWFLVRFRLWDVLSSTQSCRVRAATWTLSTESCGYVTPVTVWCCKLDLVEGRCLQERSVFASPAHWLSCLLHVWTDQCGETSDVSLQRWVQMWKWLLCLSGVSEAVDGATKLDPETQKGAADLLPCARDPSVPLNVPDRPGIPRGWVGSQWEDRRPVRGLGQWHSLSVNQKTAIVTASLNLLEHCH